MYDRAPRLFNHGTTSTSVEVGPGKYDPNSADKRKQGICKQCLNVLYKVKGEIFVGPILTDYFLHILHVLIFELNSNFTKIYFCVWLG